MSGRPAIRGSPARRRTAAAGSSTRSRRRIPVDPAASDAALYSIVNEGGSWLCEASRAAEQPISDGDRHTLVFNGEGEYEGLTAYLTIDWSQAPYVFSGLILPGEEPPYAEPQG